MPDEEEDYLGDEGEEKEEVPDLPMTIEEAQNKFLQDAEGNIIVLSDLLTPFYSMCRNCPMKTKCLQYSVKEDAECILEQGLTIEVLKLFAEVDLEPIDQLTLYSLLTMLMQKHQLDRARATADFTSLTNDEAVVGTLQKYVGMVTKIDRQYQKSLSELRATKKEREKGTAVVETSAGKASLIEMSRRAQEEKRKKKEKDADGSSG